VDRLVAAAAGVPLAAYKNPDLAAPYHLQDHRELLEVLANLPQTLRTTD